MIVGRSLDGASTLTRPPAATPGPDGPHGECPHPGRATAPHPRGTTFECARRDASRTSRAAPPTSVRTAARTAWTAPIQPAQPARGRSRRDRRERVGRSQQDSRSPGLRRGRGRPSSLAWTTARQVRLAVDRVCTRPASEPDGAVLTLR